jgi:hypothetical protein
MLKSDFVVFYRNFGDDRGWHHIALNDSFLIIGTVPTNAAISLLLMKPFSGIDDHR